MIQWLIAFSANIFFICDSSYQYLNFQAHSGTMFKLHFICSVITFQCFKVLCIYMFDWSFGLYPEILSKYFLNSCRQFFLSFHQIPLRSWNSYILGLRLSFSSILQEVSQNQSREIVRLNYKSASNGLNNKISILDIWLASQCISEATTVS